MNRARIAAFLSPLVLVLALAGPAAAQAPLEASQLPARTLFYFIWRGMPAGEARKANSLFALWDDPSVAPARAALAQTIFDSAKQKDSKSTPLTAAEWDEYAPLFDNSFVFGFLTDPQKRAGAATAPGAKPRSWDGTFFVYDRSGKEVLLAKALLRMRAAAKEPQVVSQTTIAGLPAMKFTSKSGGSSYWIEKGKYLVAGGERTVLEEILARLDGKTAGSLAESAAYQEAHAAPGRGAVEFFLRVPDLKEFVPDTQQQGIKVKPLLDALRLDAIHSVCGSVTFEGARTHLQGGILGDASAGTLFDIFADGQASPAALAFASADTIYFNSTQLNFPGIYAAVKRAARAVLPPGQQGNADILDMMAQTRLGMPVPDALALLTGEFASIQTSPVMDFDKQVYFLGIRDKANALKLMRTLFSTKISGERNEGDVTFLKVSLGGGQGSAGIAQWNFYHVAVTPDAILGASKAETLRQVLAQRGRDTAAGFASRPQFQAARAQFPQNIDGINYFDFTRVDWPGLKEHWIREMKKTSTAKSLDGQKAAAAPPAPVPAWIEQIDPQVFARHLHSAFAASWKDAKGFHLDEWLD